MAFAEAFRKKWLPNLDIESERTMTATKDVFVNDVDSYPMILIASKRSAKKRLRPNTGLPVKDVPWKSLDAS